jgi:hypothetical protein
VKFTLKEKKMIDMVMATFINRETKEVLLQLPIREGMNAYCTGDVIFTSLEGLDPGDKTFPVSMHIPDFREEFLKLVQYHSVWNALDKIT